MASVDVVFFRSLLSFRMVQFPKLRESLESREPDLSEVSGSKQVVVYNLHKSVGCMLRMHSKRISASVEGFKYQKHNRVG